MTEADVRPGVIFLKRTRHPDHGSQEFVEHLESLGASDVVVAAAKAAADY